MAEGKFDIDVQDGEGDGRFIINDDGKFQIGGGCCGKCPCCCTADGGDGVAQPDAEVTIAGSCDDFGDGSPRGRCDSNGTHFWAESREYVDLCQWLWQGGNPLLTTGIWLVWCKSNGRWYAHSEYYGDHFECPCWSGDNRGDDVTEYLTCDPETGIISGVFSLNGIGGEFYDCSGCVATVTLG